MPSRARRIHSDSSSLYVHWPYCEKRCTYCNFNKYISRNVDHDVMTECLVRELTTVIRSSSISTITTVFFGGGTPSLMRPRDVERVLQAVSRLTAAPVAEVTLECNPSPAAKDSLSDFKEAGVTRLSIGMQSLCNDAELSSLGRTHSVEESLHCLDRAMHLFPGQVSVDILYGRPRQTLDGWLQEVQQVVQLGTAHVSLYELTLERGTQLFKEVQAGLQVAFKIGAALGRAIRSSHRCRTPLLFAPVSQSLPDSETCSQMYLAAVEVLEREGLLRYEVSNFAHKGHECKHNQACWRGLQYLGIGPGAHSRVLVGDGHWEARVQTLEPNPWIREVSQRGHGTRLTRPLSRQDRLEELLMMGLRTARGICNQLPACHESWDECRGQPRLLHAATAEGEDKQVDCHGASPQSHVMPPPLLMCIVGFAAAFGLTMHNSVSRSSHLQVKGFCKASIVRRLQ
ncbi:radical S-adenosyl methionine domain-containing protein 1, mitochondrial-like isoform X2 [Dermacentor albipictus]